jgi:uncharacterized RDD family membrane protein YckC
MKQKIVFVLRGIAFIIDLMISTGLAMTIGVIVYDGMIFDNMYFIMFLGIAFLIFKDIFGKSVGKHLLGLNVVDYNVNQKPNIYQRLLRNITVPITIIEIFVVFFSKKHRRLGDSIAKTDVTQGMIPWM